MTTTNTFIATYGPLLKWMGIFSTIVFLTSLLTVPWLIGRLPEDFFLHLHEPRVRKDEHPAIFILLRVLRYSVGTALFLAGIIMLFLPGQGLITMLLGLGLLDFPGKRRAVDALVELQSVHKGLNWIRKREKKKPFLFNHDLQQD